MSGFTGFAAYEAELKGILSSGLASSDPGKFSAETTGLLDQLKLEARTADDRKTATTKFKDLKAEVDRMVLLGGGVPKGAQANNERARLMATNDKINGQNDR
jgi:hypothetical protein